MKLLSSRRARLAIAASLVAVAIGAGCTGSDAARGAAGALSMVALLGAAAALVRRGAPRPARPPALALEERHFLAKDSGIAVVVASGRRLVVGFGANGVTLLSELGRREEP